MKRKNAAVSYRTGKAERYSYSIYFIGQNIFYMFVYFFLKQFYVIDMAIPAATVATIFLVAQIWDAVNDPLFGIIIDKARMKRGKFLPWIRVSAFLIPITTIAIFALPSTAPIEFKIGFAFISYLLWDFSYTVCDAPIYALTTAMTDNAKERTKLISGARVCATLAMITLAVLVPAIYPKLGWFVSICILAVIGFACMLPISVLGRERFLDQQKREETSFRDIWIYLKGNKYLKVFYAGIIIANVLNTSASVGNFFAIYCLGSESMISIVTLLTVFPMLIMAAVLPALNKKWDKFLIYRIALITNIGFAVITFFVGYENIMFFIILTFLRNLGAGAVSVMSYMFVTDCVEYGTFATRKRAEGITFSIQTFTTKLTGALSGAIGLYILAFFHFAEGGKKQPAEAVSAIWYLITLLPALGCLLQYYLLARRYKLRDSDVQWMAKANMNEISREEALEHIQFKL